MTMTRRQSLARYVDRIYGNKDLKNDRDPFGKMRPLKTFASKMEQIGRKFKNIVRYRVRKTVIVLLREVVERANNQN